MADRETLLLEEFKMNEERVRHVSDLMLSIVKFYFVTVLAVATIATTVYEYKILEDNFKLVVYFLLLPLLLFGFATYVTLKRLLGEHEHWLKVRSDLGAFLFFAGERNVHPLFAASAKPFFGLIKLILAGNLFSFIILAFPSLSNIKGGPWAIAIGSLVAVFLLLSLFSTLAVIALNSARQKSRDSKRVADIKQVQTALELYFADHNSYPILPKGDDSLILGEEVRALVAGGFIPDLDRRDGRTVYMGMVPANPSPGGKSYVYTSSPDGKRYEISFSLEDSVGGLSKGGNLANPDGITSSIRKTEKE